MDILVKHNFFPRKLNNRHRYRICTDILLKHKFLPRKLNNRHRYRIRTDILVKHNFFPRKSNNRHRYSSRLTLYLPISTLRLFLFLHLPNYAVNYYCPCYPIIISLLLSININYPDYSLLRDKIQTRSSGVNPLIYFFNICTPVLDGEDPLAFQRQRGRDDHPWPTTLRPCGDTHRK